MISSTALAKFRHSRQIRRFRQIGQHVGALLTGLIYSLLSFRQQPWRNFAKVAIFATACISVHISERDTYKARHLGKESLGEILLFYKTFHAKNIMEACYCRETVAGQGWKCESSSREGREGWPKSYHFSVLSDYPDFFKLKDIFCLYP